MCSLPTREVAAVPEGSWGQACWARLSRALWSLGGWGELPGTVLCLQLVKKVKVSDASIQEVLEPLNLDFSSPLEKGSATVTPQTLPSSKADPAWEVLERQGAALLTPWLLQDLSPGQERRPGLRDMGLGASACVCGHCMWARPLRAWVCLACPSRALLSHSKGDTW